MIIGIDLHKASHTATTVEPATNSAHGVAGTGKLPADYVAQHVELGYAQTSHAVQGRTVDRSILLLDGPPPTVVASTSP